ncbi:hypothetical protein JP0276_05460 [Helicobacter pylori]
MFCPKSPKEAVNGTRILTKKKKEEWVNNIANLTLLKRKKNAQALNGDFDEKRKIYSGKDTSKVISCYDITKELYEIIRSGTKNLSKSDTTFCMELSRPFYT